MAYHPGCGGVVGGAAAPSQFCAFKQGKTFHCFLRIHKLHYFRNICSEHTLPRREGDAKMSAFDTLLKYIASITPEQASEIQDALPKDGKLSKEEYIAKIIVMLKECNDIPLIDLVYRLLLKSI
jgi:hypothetical protein